MTPAARVLLAIDTLPDMFRTMTNVTATLPAAPVMARSATGDATVPAPVGASA